MGNFFVRRKNFFPKSHFPFVTKHENISLIEKEFFLIFVKKKTFLIFRLFKAAAVNLQINKDSAVRHFATEKTNLYSI